MQRIRKNTHLEAENLNSGLLHEQIPFGLEAQMLMLVDDHTNTAPSNNKPQTSLITTPKLTAIAFCMCQCSSRGHIYHCFTQILTFQQPRNADKSVQQVKGCSNSWGKIRQGTSS